MLTFVLSSNISTSETIAFELWLSLKPSSCIRCVIIDRHSTLEVFNIIIIIVTHHTHHVLVFTLKAVSRIISRDSTMVGSEEEAVLVAMVTFTIHQLNSSKYSKLLKASSGAQFQSAAKAGNIA